MDGLMLYHYMNIASPRLSVLAFKFHPNLTIFAGESSYKSHWTPGNWTPSQQEHHHWTPTGQAIFVKWLLPRCLSVSPSAAIAGFRASARWSWRTLGLVVLVGTKMKKHIYTNTKQHVKRKACNYVNMNTYLEPQPVHTSPKSPIIPWSSHVSCLNSKHPIKNPAFS